MKMSPLILALLGFALVLVASFLVLFMGDDDDYGVGDEDSSAPDLSVQGPPTGTARRSHRRVENRRLSSESLETEAEEKEPSGRSESVAAHPVIMGRVIRDGSETPVAGARVGLMTSSIVESLFTLDMSSLLRLAQEENRPVVEVETDEKGVFRFEQAAPGDYTVLVKAKGLGRRFSDSFRVPERGEVGDVLVRLKPAIRFEGVVRNRDGLPVSGVQVNLFDMKRDQMAVVRTYQARTNRDGHFVFTDLAPGRYAGTLRAEGYGPTSMGNIRLDGKKGSFSPPAEYVMPSEGEVFGRVFDAATGKGLEGAVVFALVKVADSGLPVYREVRSGVDGAYTLKGISKMGSFIVGVRMAGFSLKMDTEGRSRGRPGIQVQAEDRSGDRDLVDLPMVGGAIVGGRVLAKGSLLPIQGAEVVIYSPNTIGNVGKTSPVITDANGRFEVKDVPAGRFVVTASHPDFVAVVDGSSKSVVEEVTEDDDGADEDRSRRRFLEPGEVRDSLQVIMVRAVRLRGRVVDSDGEPVAAAWVEFHTDGKKNVMFVSLTRTPRHHVTSDVDGRFELTSVPRAKKVVITAEHSRYASSARKELNLASGPAPSELTLVVGPGATLSGTAFDAQGGPLIGGRVTLVSSDVGRGTNLGIGIGPRRRRDLAATTDDEGRFRIDAIPAGAYDVTLKSKTVQVLRLNAGERRSVELRLPREVAISGIVLHDDGTPFPGASIVATAVEENGATGSGGKDQRPRRVKSDERGRFRLVVPEGKRYELRGWRIAEETDSAGKTRRVVWASDMKAPHVAEPGDQNVRVVLTRQ